MSIDGEVSVSILSDALTSPGPAEERAVSLAAMPAALAREIADLAEDAAFFDPERHLEATDRRGAYILQLSIGNRTRRVILTEPIRDWNMIALFSAAAGRAISRRVGQGVARR